MKKKKSKNSTGKKNLYLPIINQLEKTTNLSKIQNNLGLSKQQLNYYLRRLKKMGLIEHKGGGWYEPVKGSKNSTKYGSLLSKDSSRGHAYIWEVELPKEIKGWDKRIEILEKKAINFKRVGALKTTPRIKALGRKIWLCNDHLRIFDTKKASYYGETAKESKQKANLELFRIITCLENKLGFLLKPFKFSIQKEHYALIRNDLAIDHNQKGVIMQIRDDRGDVWLLVDDSLGEGGELENIGKKAYKTNIPMQKWWNDNKKHGFEVTPTFVLEQFSKLIEDRKFYAENNRSHVEAIQILGQTVKDLKEEIKKQKTRNFIQRIINRIKG